MSVYSLCEPYFEASQEKKPNDELSFLHFISDVLFFSPYPNIPTLRPYPLQSPISSTKRLDVEKKCASHVPKKCKSCPTNVYSVVLQESK